LASSRLPLHPSHLQVLDAVRYQTAVEAFPILFRAGGWIPLAGMQFRFLREIQTLNSYEVWTSILTWEDKWVRNIHSILSLLRLRLFWIMAISEECLIPHAFTTHPLYHPSSHLIFHLHRFTSSTSLLRPRNPNLEKKPSTGDPYTRYQFPRFASRSAESPCRLLSYSRCADILLALLPFLQLLLPHTLPAHGPIVT